MSTPALTTDPGTVTPRQISALHRVAIRRGLDHEALREAAGVESLKHLSRAEASKLIRRLGGGDLPHAPGTKPAPSRAPTYRRNRARSASEGTRAPIRMITPDQEEQLYRLGVEFFCDSSVDFVNWLRKNFKVELPRELATAVRAGQVIAVLSRMIDRRNNRARSTSEGTAHEP